MRTSICVIAATLVAFVGAENAWADAEAGQGYLSIMATYMDDDEDRDTEKQRQGEERPGALAWRGPARLALD